MTEWTSGTTMWPLGGDASDVERFKAEAAYVRDRDMAVDHEHCFLCGIPLTDANRTDEHVFPKWLQRRFNLWNTQLTLLNRTTIPYRSLTVPCCFDCNSYWLSQVESHVAAAFEQGHNAVRALDRTLLCLWMWKLYYGIHFKEVALPADRREPEGSPIVSSGYLGRFAEIHHVLQAMRRKVWFRIPPGSLFVFEAQVPERVEHQFDYRDSILSPFLAVRVAHTVLMVSFDWGAMGALISGPRFEAAAAIPLHPFQFFEVSAFGIYVASRFDRRFAYLVTTTDTGQDVMEPVLMGPKEQLTGPVFKPPDAQQWASVFANCLGRKADEVRRPEDANAVWTTLVKPDGTPNFMPLDQVPYGTDIRPEWQRPPAESV